MASKIACALACAAVLLSGCAGLPSKSSEQPAAAHANRPYRESLTLSGRLSVQYQQDDKPQGLHGSFDWAQTPDNTEITLRSPLGQVIAAIKVTPHSATLAEAGKSPVSAPDADRLAAHTLGWPLPVSGLRNWLQGYAYDAAGKPVIAAPGQQTELRTADGWHLHYAAWQEDGTAPPRPKRIDLERVTNEAGKVSIRIVIDNWQES